MDVSFFSSSLSLLLLPLLELDFEFDDFTLELDFESPLLELDVTLFELLDFSVPLLELDDLETFPLLDELDVVLLELDSSLTLESSITISLFFE